MTAPFTESFRRSIVASFLVATCSVPSGAFADAAAPAAPSPAAAASYNDAGMHFDAPPGWESIPVAGGGGGDNAQSDDATPVAAFIYHRGKTDQVAIVIKTAPFEGRVDEFDTSHNSELRKNGDTFIAKNEKIALGNGMPAYFVKANSGSEAGHYTETLEYLVCDGTRSIDVTYFGGEGTFDEAKARSAFATLYVVAFPTRRS